tara:strand:- start:1963 stop:2307 length:345 start_codon:yes stop_codon:yes gene_type:complete
MSKLALGILFFAIGNVIAWFQFNAQFVWPWWKDKPWVTQFLFAVPMGLSFWYAVKNIVEHSGALWTSKLVGFGVGNVVFAIMTYVLMRESMFTAKTMTCLALSSMIIGVQIFWK